MKKSLSLALAVCLALGLCLPAAASADTDSRLAAVTQTVKQTLNLDTSSYNDFQGELQEGSLVPFWNLSWTCDASSLRINANEDGTIIYYNLYDNSSNHSDNSPSFPKGNITSAKQAASAFLKKVLKSSVETASFESESGNCLNSNEYSFSGTILLNGLTSPEFFSITVRGSDNTITNFNRDNLSQDHIGGIPSATPAVTSSQAAQKLKTTLSLNLEYVLDDSGKAVLRYLPVVDDKYYVDAQTGELTNLTELYQKVNANSTAQGRGGMNQSLASEDKGTLTDAEQAGIEKLDGVLSKADLDAKLKAIAPLNLSGYTLGTACYSLGDKGKDGTTPVLVSLRYAKKTGDTIQSRTVNVNGRTGALISLYGNTYSTTGKDLTTSMSSENAKALVSNYLTTYYGKQFAETKLYQPTEAEKGDTSVSINYCQSVNGYFYSGNYFDVTVDLTDGSIQSFDSNFDDSIVFDSADKIVDKSAALDAYLAFYSVPLNYISIPTAIDYTKPEYKTMIDIGYSYLYQLKLGYVLDNNSNSLSGIDAKTGKAVTAAQTEDTKALTYNDLNGNWIQPMAEKLASYQVGFTGGSFLPTQKITQVELVNLLVSASTIHYDMTALGQVDQLYAQAYSMGILTAKERNDSATVTRAEMVKMLLDSAGYSRVASLKSIYSPGFSDDKAIPDGFVGYVALAKGFNLVQGDASGKFRPSDTATRAEALAMLYRYMSL